MMIAVLLEFSDTRNSISSTTIVYTVLEAKSKTRIGIPYDPARLGWGIKPVVGSVIHDIAFRHPNH